MQEAYFHVALRMNGVWIVALKAAVLMTAVELKEPVLLRKKSVDEVLANLPLAASDLGLHFFAYPLLLPFHPF